MNVIPWTMLATVRLIFRRGLTAFGWLRGGHISIAIVVAVLIGAVHALPFSFGSGSAPAPWRVPRGGPALIDGQNIPVFCLEGVAPAVRCGIAEAHADGQVGFREYGDAPPGKNTIPVLTAADIGLLWALADPGARTRLQASAAEVVRQMAVSVRDVTASEPWQREYRGKLGTLLDRSAMQAWQAEDTGRAFRAFLRASEPVIRDSVTNEIGPVVAPYLAGAFWQMVKTTSSQVLSLITGSPLDLTSVGTSFAAALQNPEVQSAFGRLGPHLVAIPQTEVLFERMAANMADALQRDPETMDLMTRAVMDPRLGEELRQVRGDVATFAHELAKTLWGLGDSRSMNPLAGLSVKTAILGVSQPLILLLPPDDAVTLVHTIPGRATMLVPEAAR